MLIYEESLLYQVITIILVSPDWVYGFEVLLYLVAVGGLVNFLQLDLFVFFVEPKRSP